MEAEIHTGVLLPCETLNICNAIYGVCLNVCDTTLLLCAFFIVIRIPVHVLYAMNLVDVRLKWSV